MAPEILMVRAGKMYGHSVDWWALGVVMFEMMSGVSPFGGASENNEIFKDVLHQKIR